MLRNRPPTNAAAHPHAARTHTHTPAKCHTPPPPRYTPAPRSTRASRSARGNRTEVDDVRRLVLLEQRVRLVAVAVRHPPPHTMHPHRPTATHHPQGALGQRSCAHFRSAPSSEVGGEIAPQV